MGMAQTDLRIGLAGLGTVGAGVIKLLDENASIVGRRAGRAIRVTAVSARDRTRERGVDTARFAWVDNAPDLAARDDVDCVVELVGGSDGPALATANATLQAGKSFVTANKAMLAHHGLELAALAEKAGAALKFEAAVGGGIPVIKGMREGLAANDVTSVYGILNGTCNYILTTMEKDGSDFAAVLADAQALGYAEADPSFDVDGIDAAHKLAILATLGFGSAPDFAHVSTLGIRAIKAADIAFARQMNYRIKLIGRAEMINGALYQRVSPTLVPLNHPIAHVDSSLNAVVVEGNYVGRLLFQGRGAGEGPTASAVVADLIDVARGEWGPAFAIPAAQLSKLPAADADVCQARFYQRLTVKDQPGVLADVTAILRDCGVSLATVLQRGKIAQGKDDSGGVYVVLTTHLTTAGAMKAASTAMAALEAVLVPPLIMPIMD
jgi:homoserine dehydrogenase